MTAHDPTVSARPQPSDEPLDPRRLQRLEESLAFQQHDQDQLSVQLFALTRQLDALTRRIASLEAALARAEEASRSAGSSPPEGPADEEQTPSPPPA